MQYIKRRVTLAEVQHAMGGSSSGWITYVVRNGDTLERVARIFCLTTDALADWNGVQPKDALRPGQQIRIYCR